ncbi:MAG: SDR family oxidoreductase [Actinomycetota bacterium]|nr:SDR family oxidoreductase [Actinomycetota bacterium]
MAQRLSAEGAALTLLARDRGRLEETASGLEGPVQCLSCDIRDRAGVEDAFARAAARLGAIHALIANAGIGGPNAPGPEDRFEDLVATNLVGTYSCIRAAQRHLAPGPATRHIVVTASVLARIAVPVYTGYSASKAGLLGLVRSLAAELAAQNVQVNAICPGWVKTEMTWEGLDAMPGTREEAYERAMREVPLRRMSEPEEIAGTVAWLLSDDARGVTGQAIDHNNGAFML